MHLAVTLVSAIDKVMTHSTDKKATDKKVKLAFSPDLFQAAKSEAERTVQTLEDWVLVLVEQHLLRQDTVQALDWGRIDSRIDSRIDQHIIFLERRIDGLSEQIAQLSKQPLSQAEPILQ